jgi:hypothetical protein
MDHNSNTTTKKVTVGIPIVEYIAKTTTVEVDYEFFNKKFPGLMTEQQFNKFAEDSYEEFEYFEWNGGGDPWEVDGDKDDEETWLKNLNDPDTDMSGLKDHISEQVEKFLGDLKPESEEEKEDEEEEEEEEEDEEED